MSSGLPDFYRGIDVAFQSLGQIINRPKYGGAVQSAGSVVVTASVQTQIISVLGKGMVYGGILFLDYTSTQRDSFPVLLVDGVNINPVTFTNLNKYGVNIPRAYSIAMAVYNDVDFIYSVQFSYGITFESSVSIEYQEEHGTTPVVASQLTYALI